MFRGLDWVVAEAGRRGLKLMMTLTNYWEDYGGFPQYVRCVVGRLCYWAGGRVWGRGPLEGWCHVVAAV